MNLKEYYRAISAQEAAIEDAFVFVISLPVANGGREGVVSEVSRRMAAAMIVEKKARLATAEEAGRIRADRKQQERMREAAALEERVRALRAAEDELKALKKALQQPRKGA